MPLFPQPASTTNSNNIFNLVFTTSVAANALTVNFIANNIQAAATTANPATVGFGSGGQISFISLTSAYSFTVPSGATLGTPSATAVNLYIYALNVSGVLKGAISYVPFTTEDVLVSTIALSSGATSNRTMFSDGLYSNVTYRMIGLINITEATAGTWASNATNVVPYSPSMTKLPIACRYKTATPQTIASTPSQFNFGTSVFDNYNAITNPTSAWLFTAPLAGDYYIYARVLANTSSVALSVTDTFYLYSYVNGVQYSTLGHYVVNSAINNGSFYCDIFGSDIINLNAGDTLSVYVQTNRASSVNSYNVDAWNYVNIFKISSFF